MGVGDGSNGAVVVDVGEDFGVAEWSNGAGVADAGREVEVGGIMAAVNCVAIRVVDDSTNGTPCGRHAVHRIRIERKVKDFIFALATRRLSNQIEIRIGIWTTDRSTIHQGAIVKLQPDSM
jgi:hypothetical protein